MHDELITDFFAKGVGITNDPDAFKIVESILPTVTFKPDGISKYCLLAEETDTLVDALEDTGDWLFEKYLSQIFQKNNLVYTHLWKGADDDTQIWHNDYREGADLSFLLYFNNLNEETGGGFEIKEEDSDDIVGPIYPNKYDVLLFNQQKNWVHQVTPLKKLPVERLVMNFGFGTERWI